MTPLTSHADIDVEVEDDRDEDDDEEEFEFEAEQEKEKGDDCGRDIRVECLQEDQARQTNEKKES